MAQLDEVTIQGESTLSGSLSATFYYCTTLNIALCVAYKWKFCMYAMLYLFIEYLIFCYTNLNTTSTPTHDSINLYPKVRVRRWKSISGFSCEHSNLVELVSEVSRRCYQLFQPVCVSCVCGGFEKYSRFYVWGERVLVTGWSNSECTRYKWVEILMNFSSGWLCFCSG